ncbi:MAG: sel1 repeat family protein [Alphaproteobacteria bacterium]|nr:sel1 repeat family protein [Alphaproteobacteria bacterium]
MEAVVKQHPVKGKGWAVITLSGDGVPQAGVKFQLRRGAGRDAILGPTGWQATELWLDAGETAPAPGGLALTVGPEVVNHMDTANYALLVTGDGVSAKQPLQAGLAWRNIAQLALGRGKRGGVAVRGEVDEAAAARARAAAAAQAAEAERAAAEAAAAAARKAADDKARDAADTTSQATDDDGKQRKASRAPLLGLLVAALIIGGGAAWWLWPQPPIDDKKKEERKAEEKKPEEAKKPEETKKTEEAKKEVELPKIPDTGDDLPAGADPLKFAREKLQAGMEPARALALGDKLMQRPPAGIDAAFLVYRYAAQKGDANAAFKLAKIVDPADDTPSGTLKKAPESALEWYRSAAGGKHPEAGASIARLKAWVEKQAGTGDADAQRLLKQFPAAP